MWLTPYLSSTSRVRSASACDTEPSAAAPNSVRVLTCPVRPKGSVGIVIVYVPSKYLSFSSILGYKKRLFVKGNDGFRVDSNISLTHILCLSNTYCGIYGVGIKDKAQFKVLVSRYRVQLF